MSEKPEKPMTPRDAIERLAETAYDVQALRARLPLESMVDAERAADLAALAVLRALVDASERQEPRKNET